MPLYDRSNDDRKRFLSPLINQLKGVFTDLDEAIPVIEKDPKQGWQLVIRDLKRPLGETFDEWRDKERKMEPYRSSQSPFYRLYKLIERYVADRSDKIEVHLQSDDVGGHKGIYRVYAHRR